MTTTIRFWVYQHTPDGPAAVPTGGPHTASSSGRYASPLPTTPRSIDLGRFIYNESTGELFYRVRLAGALSIKRVSPNQERGPGARTRTFSLFEPSPAAAAEGVPGVSVSHIVIEDTPLLARGPSGRLRVGSGSGQGGYGDWRNRPLTSVIDFSGFATALGRMAGLFGARIHGALSGIDVSPILEQGRQGGPFPIHTYDMISPLEEEWGAPRPRGGNGFGGDELASVVAVVAAAVTHPGGWAAAWAGTWAGFREAGGGQGGNEVQAAKSAANPPSATSSMAVAANAVSAPGTGHQSGLALPVAAGVAAATTGAAAAAAEKRPTAEQIPPPRGNTANRHRNRRRRERAAARRRRAAAAARPPGAVEDTSRIIVDEPTEVAATIVATPAVASAAFADGDAASESDGGHGAGDGSARDKGNQGVAASAAAARDAGGGVEGQAGDQESGADLSARHVTAFANLFEGPDEWTSQPM